MSSLPVTIENFPGADLAGLKVTTTMKDAPKDCSGLWQKSCPVLFPLRGEDKTSYGISRMVDETTFDYWAAVIPGFAAPLPPEAERVQLPAGLYAACHVTGLEQLGTIYTYLYGQWASEQTEFALDYARPCFEMYPPSYPQDGNLFIYVPVTPKN